VVKSDLYGKVMVVIGSLVLVAAVVMLWMRRSKV
jgi:folylpolyglutamate synthase/dihydropteroate synthase